MKRLLMLPGPTNVPERVVKAMCRPIINHRGTEFQKLHEGIEDNLRYLFQTKNLVFPLTCSGTGGVECAISNTIADGDKILVPLSGVFSERLKERAELAGGKTIAMQTDWDKGITAGHVKEALEKNPDAKAVAVIYNETSTGAKVNDLQKIGRTVREHGALFIVDAVSVLGGDELPVDKWNVDICVTGSQKCLAAPPGLSIISVSDKAWDVINRTKRKDFYFDLLRYKKFYEEKKETPFTPAISLFFALDEALKMIREEGLEKRIERHRKCARAFYDAVEAMGLKVFTHPDFRSNTVIAIHNPAGIDDKNIRDTMANRHGIVLAGGMGKLRGTMFRIGNIGSVSEPDVVRTVEALEKTLAEMDFKFDAGSGVKAAEKAF